MPFKYTVCHVPSGQNIADCLSHWTMTLASPCDGVTEEYVRMVAVKVALNSFQHLYFDGLL